MELYELLTNSVATVGFPIVAFYLMYRLVTETIKENTNALNKISNCVSRLLEKEDCKEDD